MYYDDIFLQNGFIDMLCKISNQFVERLDVLSFDDVRPLLVDLLLLLLVESLFS